MKIKNLTNDHTYDMSLLANFSLGHRQCHAHFSDISQMIAAAQSCKPHVLEWCQDTCYHEYSGQFRLERLLPVEYAYPIYGVIFPVLLVALIICNIFVVLVLSKKHMASPTNTVLLYMAVADLFVGIVPFPFTFIYYNLGFYEQADKLEVWWCYLHQFLMNALPPLCHNVAIWLTVLLAVQRYIYIRHPLTAKTWCTVANVRKTSIVLCTVSVLGGCLKFFEVNFKKFDGFYVSVDEGSDPSTPSQVRSHGHAIFCAARYTSLVDFMGVTLFYNLYMWVRVLGFLLIPSGILISMNFLLITELRRASERRRRLFASSSSQQTAATANKKEAMKQKESQSTNLMLILVVSIFLLVNLPQATLMAAVSVSVSFNLNWSLIQTNIPNLIAMVDNMLILLSYPLNFAIYCSMSAQFRDTFRGIFSCSRTTPRADPRSTSSIVAVNPGDHLTSATDLLTKNCQKPSGACDKTHAKGYTKFYPNFVGSVKSKLGIGKHFAKGPDDNMQITYSCNEPASTTCVSEYHDELL